MLTRKMKNSGIEWMGEIPENWEVKKVKYMFRIVNGNGFPEHLQGEKEGDYPFYKNSDINKLGIYINDSNNYISKNTAIINKFTVIPSKSILIGKIGEALKRNHRKINLSECIIDNNMMALVPKENELFSYYLLTIIDMFWFDNNGTVPSINSNKLRNFKIPYVNKTLQKNIVEILNKKTQKIDNLISSTQQSIKELKKYKQSLITEVVTKGIDQNAEMKDSGIEWIGKIPKHWEIKQLKYLTQERKEQLSRNTDKDFILNYVDIGSVTFENGIENFEKLRFQNSPSRARKIVYKNDIIVSTVRTYLKSIARIKNDNEYIVSTGFCVLIPNQNNNPTFIEFLIKADFFTNQVEMNSKGIAYPSITPDKLLSLYVIEPPLCEQNKIVSYLDEQICRLNKIIEDKTKLIEELEAYKKSLIYEYVTGKKEV